MITKILEYLKSISLFLLLGIFSIMPWLGYIEVPMMNEDFLILSWMNPESFFDAFKNFFQAEVGGPYWRPVVWTLDSLTKYFFEYNSAPYHITNILIYSGICFLLFSLLKHLGFERKQAWLGAFVFAVLPSHELSVAWIAGRTDTLMTLFLLVSLIIYVRNDREIKQSFLALFLFSLAVLSKEPSYAAVAMPFGLLIIMNRKLEKRDYKDALYSSIAATCVVVVLLVYRLLVIGGTPFESNNFSEISFSRFALNYLIYIPVSFMRADQAELLYHTIISNSAFLVSAIILFLTLITILIIKYIRMETKYKRLFVFGFFWYSVMIIPACFRFGQWYVFSASIGLVIMGLCFYKPDLSKFVNRYFFYFVVGIGVISAVGLSSRSEKWLTAAEISEQAFKSIRYAPFTSDTLIFLGVPDKINQINAMKIGFTQAIWHHLGNDSIDVSSPLRLEMSEESNISYKISGQEIMMQVANGRFLLVGTRARAVIIDEETEYEDGYQIIHIQTQANPIPISNATVTIKNKALFEKVYIFTGNRFEKAK